MAAGWWQQTQVGGGSGSHRWFLSRRGICSLTHFRELNLTSMGCRVEWVGKWERPLGLWGSLHSIQGC